MAYPTGGKMGNISARQKFEAARDAADNEAMKLMAEGLIQLSRAIEEQLKKLPR
jgi:hypothetical protein